DVYDAYRLPVPTTGEVAASIRDGLTGEWIDFGLLDEDLQEEIVRRIAFDEHACDELIAINPSLSRWDRPARTLLAANQEVVRKHYSPEAIGRRLRAVYNAVSHQPCGAVEVPADTASLLQAFLDLHRFRLIRT